MGRPRNQTQPSRTPMALSDPLLEERSVGGNRSRSPLESSRSLETPHGPMASFRYHRHAGCTIAACADGRGLHYYIHRWQYLSNNNAQWRALEYRFSFRVTRQKRPRSVLPGRHQIWPTQKQRRRTVTVSPLVLSCPHHRYITRVCLSVAIAGSNTHLSFARFFCCVSGQRASSHPKLARASHP